MTNHARLFVELIRKATGGKYANWSPPKKVQVGDYGTVDKETGEFERAGNIYDPEFAPELELGKKHPAQAASPDDQLTVVSRGVKVVSFDATAASAYPELAAATIKGRWSFSSGQGAVLFLVKPTESSITDLAKVLPKLQHHPELADKALVTDVFTCPMYALLLVRDSDAQAEAAIGVTIFDGSQASASVQAKWHFSNTSGLRRCGGEGGRSLFYPLFTLWTPKTKSFLDRLKGRREGPILEGEDTFMPYPAPWAALDSNGDELEDDVSDDEKLKE